MTSGVKTRAEATGKKKQLQYTRFERIRMLVYTGFTGRILYNYSRKYSQLCTQASKFQQ